MNDRISDLKNLSEEEEDEEENADESEVEAETEPEIDDTGAEDEAEDESNKQNGDAEGSNPAPDPEPEDEQEDETEPMSTSTNNDESAESTSAREAIEESEPAFSGDDFTQKTIYGTEPTWQKYEDAMTRMDLDVMRSNLGLRNVTGREREEAMVRLAAENPEAIAEYVLEARGLDVDIMGDNS